MELKKYLLLYILPLILYASFIVYVSSISDIPTIRGIVSHQQVPRGTWTGDNIEHIIEYAILAFLFFRALQPTKWKNKAVIATIIFTTAFGFFDELHQYFVPCRNFSILDLLWDFTGGLIISFISWVKSFK